MGGIGMIGTKADYKAMMDCDLLLMLGTDYPYSESCPAKASSSRWMSGRACSDAGRRPSSA